MVSFVRFEPVAVTVVPPRGWRQLGSPSCPKGGAGSFSDWLELIDDEVCVTVRAGLFPGTADELLDEIIGVDSAGSSPWCGRRQVRGVSDATWMLTEYHGPDDDYIAAAAVIDCPTTTGVRLRVGIEVVAEGWAETLASRTAMIDLLIASITVQEFSRSSRPRRQRGQCRRRSPGR